MSATRTNRTNLSIARKAGLFVAATAGTLTLTASLAGTASALTPEPGPDAPVIAFELPDGPGPGLGGPQDLGIAQDGPGVDGPDGFTTPEPDEDGPGLGGPDGFTTPDPDEDGPGFGGPDGFTTPEHEDPIDPVDPVDPEVADESGTAADSDELPQELAFTGTETNLAVAALVLLLSGGAALTGGHLARRRNELA